MTIYAGLDVSDKTTHLCVVDGDGAVVKRDVVASDPEVLARWLNKHCPGLARVVLETGPLSTFLYHGLAERGVPVECICARHANGVLSTRINKSDVHDAEGLAQLARTGCVTVSVGEMLDNKNPRRSEGEDVGCFFFPRRTGGVGAGALGR